MLFNHCKQPPTNFLEQMAILSWSSTSAIVYHCCQPFIIALLSSAKVYILLLSSSVSFCLVIPAPPRIALTRHPPCINLSPAVCRRDSRLLFVVSLQPGPTIHELPCFASCLVCHVLPSLIIHYFFKYQHITGRLPSSSLVCRRNSKPVCLSTAHTCCLVCYC